MHAQNSTDITSVYGFVCVNHMSIMSSFYSACSRYFPCVQDVFFRFVIRYEKNTHVIRKVRYGILIDSRERKWERARDRECVPNRACRQSLNCVKINECQHWKYRVQIVCWSVSGARAKQSIKHLFLELAINATDFWYWIPLNRSTESFDYDMNQLPVHMLVILCMFGWFRSSAKSSCVDLFN